METRAIVNIQEVYGHEKRSLLNGHLFLAESTGRFQANVSNLTRLSYDEEPLVFPLTLR